MTLYQQVSGLDREAHANLKVRPIDFRFARNEQTAPLTGVEFFRASLFFPIVFVGEDPEGLFPVALLSPHKNRNQFIDENGVWTTDYIPAFFRRYPYILSDDGNVCIDMDSGAFSENEGEPLFEGEKNGARLEEAVTFLAQYKEAAKDTRDSCGILYELNLLKSHSIQFHRDGGASHTIDGFSVVDENKLAALPDARVIELFRSGALAWITAHRMSMAHLERLGSAASKAPDAEQANSEK